MAIIPPFRPTIKQKEVLLSDAKIIVCGGAAGGGKSALFPLFIQKHLRPDIIIAVFRQKATQLKDPDGLFMRTINFFANSGDGRSVQQITPKIDYNTASNEEFEILIQNAIKNKLPHNHPDFPIAVYRRIKINTNQTNLSIKFSFNYHVDVDNQRQRYLQDYNAEFYSMYLQDLQSHLIYEDKNGEMKAGWLWREVGEQDLIELRQCKAAPLNPKQIFDAHIQFKHLNERYDKDENKESGKELPYIFLDEGQEIDLPFIRGTIFERCRFPTKILFTSPTRLNTQVVITCNPASGWLFNTLKSDFLDPKDRYRPIESQCDKIWLMTAGNEGFDLIDPESEKGKEIVGDQSNLNCIENYETFKFIPFRAIDNPYRDINYISKLHASCTQDRLMQIVYGSWSFGFDDVLFPRGAFQFYDYADKELLADLNNNLDLYIATADFAHKSDDINDQTVIAMWGIDFFPKTNPTTQKNDLFHIYLLDILLTKDHNNKKSNALRAE